MAKRFTDTEKWKRDWYLNLTPTEKVFWSYLCDVCSPAGIWNVSWKSAEFHVGGKLDKRKIEETFAKQIVPIDSGRKWFLVDFVAFQYKHLNPNNPAHKGAIEELQRYSLVASDYSISLPDNNIKGPSEDLECTCQGAMDMDKDMDKGKGKDMGKETGDGNIPLILADLPGFLSAWQDWAQYRREAKKPLTKSSQKAQLSKLAELPDPVGSIRQSIERQWQGLFEVKDNGTNRRAGAGQSGKRETFTEATIARLVKHPAGPA